MENGIGLKIILTLAKPLASASLKKIKQLKPIEQFRLEQAIENAIAEVWDSLDPFLTSEKVGDNKRIIVATACESELRPFANDVTLLLKGSLDGEKLFEQLRAESPFPQEIKDEGLEQVYRMVFPLMASVLCRAPVILEQIGEKSLAEVLNRFDQLKEQVSNVSAGIAQVRHEPQRRADELYNRVLQQALKKVLLGVEVTGLYGDSPLKQAKEEMFVLPAITETLSKYEEERGKRSPREAGVSSDHSNCFLSKKARSIVRGAPGAGKSTWSRWLQAHAMREMGLLALHVKLRSWQEGLLPTVLKLLSELVGPNMAAEIDAQAVARWVKLGNIAVLLDGFDEVAPDRREAMISAVNEMADYLQDGPCLVTSRPLHSDHLERLSAFWTAWHIQPFDKPRILDYIGRWYRHAPLKEGASREVDASALHAVLTKDPHVKPLTSNPLMLATLLMVHHNDGELPKGRSRLYARYIDGMLGIWDDRQEVHADVSGLDREQKKRVLTSLAIALHLDNKDELGEADTQALISSALKSYGNTADAQQVLNSLRERSGLIIGPGSYSFSHKSVGEFLVAQAICDGDRMVKGQKLDRFLLNVERANDRWLNVVYFWAGSAPVAEVQSFIEALDEVQDLSLRLGLLWDQMDRFQTDWLGGQVRAALTVADQKLEKERLPKLHYFCWRFEELSKDETTKAPTALILNLRHVSVTDFDSERLEPLVTQCGFKLEDIANLKSLGCFNLAFGALTGAIQDLPTRMQIIAKNKRWPIWLRKSQIAIVARQHAEVTTTKQAVAVWMQAFGDEHDSAELWITAAFVLQIRLGRHKEDAIAARLQALIELLKLPWSKEALRLSRQYFPIHVLNNGKNKNNDLLELVEEILATFQTENSNLLSLIESARAALKQLMKTREESVSV